MSAFIGPIHYWLYKKIRLVTARENHLFAKAEAMCGATAEELREQVWQTYGVPLPDADLGELIDHDNIHGWLQRQIIIAETREAAFVKEWIAACGSAAEALVGEAFAEHGRAAGEAARAAGKYEAATADGIYQALNDYYLNGMPCDQADILVSSQPGRRVWKSEQCLQAPNWRRAGISEAIMDQYYQCWLAAFVAGLNPRFGYRRLAGDPATGTTSSEIYKL